MKENQKNLHELFKVLADKNRFEIMLQLLEGKKCVCELTMALKLEQTLVSHHLGVLKKHNLIKTLKFGKWTYCYINPKTLESVKKLFLSTFQRLVERSQEKNNACT
jgi:ArsR family transcriptional regulator